MDIRASRAVAAANPRFELKELPGVGHVPQLETPEAFVEIALAWLDRRATPRAA